MMMLTTPAMASEPYTAEAPSFNISMRSTAAGASVFRSNASPARPPALERRPLTSTSVLPAGSPRSVTVAVPSPPLLTAVLVWLPITAGMKRSRSPRLCAPLASISGAPSTCTGPEPR